MPKPSRENRFFEKAGRILSFYRDRSSKGDEKIFVRLIHKTIKQGCLIEAELIAPEALNLG
jgi:hypothetical protein